MTDCGALEHGKQAGLSEFFQGAWLKMSIHVDKGQVMESCVGLEKIFHLYLEGIRELLRDSEQGNGEARSNICTFNQDRTSKGEVFS